MTSKSLLVLACISALVIVSECGSVNNRLEQDDSRSYVDNQKVNEIEDDSWWAFPSKQLNMLQRMFNDCSSGSPISVCLKAKAVTFLDRVLRKDSVQLMDGLSLVADKDSTQRARAGRALSEQELVASLPRELNQKEETLDQLIVAKLTEFFNGHQVKLNLADATDVGEARKKSKKLLPFFAIAAYMASMWYAITLKGIAAIAAKALIIGKIALVLSAIIGLKKLTHHGDH